MATQFPTYTKLTQHVVDSVHSIIALMLKWLGLKLVRVHVVCEERNRPTLNDTLASLQGL